MTDSNQEISQSRAEREFGVSQRHEVMANGECRFRLTQSSGSGYILTISGEAGGWQRSHSHEFLTEIYIVERGWMALARSEPRHSQPVIEIYSAGDLTTVAPGVPHNVFLPSGTEVHTIKVASKVAKDWIAQPQLDELVLGITEADLRQKNGMA